MDWLTGLTRRFRSAPATESTLVWIGFVGLLGLMGALAIDAHRELRQVADKGAALRQASRDRNRLLGELRGDYFRSSTLIRDYLLEERASGPADELRRIRPKVDAALGELRSGAPAEEAAEIDVLRARTADYWKALEPALQWSAGARQAEGRAFVLETVLPQRNELVQLVRQVNDMDLRNLDAAEWRLQDLQTGVQRRIARMSGAMLAIGAALALLVGVRLRSLERESARRLAEARSAREGLRLLQNRLVESQEEERRRIARELHDDVGQDLNGMLRDLDHLESTVGAHREQFAGVRRMVEQTVGKVRDLALMLRPSMLDELGLGPALRWQAREVTRRTGLPVRVEADEVEELAEDALSTCVYRLAQEALHNCVRHAHATEARVAVRRGREGLEVSSEDNGVGFDSAREKGLGLLGMTERVERLGGELRIESQPGRGTRVRARLPLGAGAPESGA
jgi:signal transduction histidine kinase